MKILSLRIYHYVATVSSIIIMVALIAGIIGCGPTPVRYDLNISSTAGGSVTIPGERTITYYGRRVVRLVATASVGYCFINWTGDVGTIANVNSASTTITMCGDYSIIANFDEVPPGAGEIWDWYDLDAARNNLDNSYTLMCNLDSTTAGYADLASTIANGGKGWEPIATDIYPFTGNFDGQGYEISNLFINRPNEEYVGLFGFLGEGGFIENVGVVNTTVTGNESVGGLVGYLPCSSLDAVSNSFFNGIVSGNYGVGGLVGRGGSNVRDSYSSGNVSGNNYVGGLVGYFPCVPPSAQNVTNCYSSANVTGNLNVGGLVGYQNWCCGVSECFWDMETSGQATSDGGIGKNTTEMQDITTFSGVGWDICDVSPGSTNSTCTWNIVNGVTYPFLSWES